MCLGVCMALCAHTCMCVCTCGGVGVHGCVCTHLCGGVHVGVWVYMAVCTRAWVCTCTCVCVGVCMAVCVHVCVGGAHARGGGVHWYRRGLREVLNDQAHVHNPGLVVSLYLTRWFVKTRPLKAS